MSVTYRVDVLRNAREALTAKRALAATLTHLALPFYTVLLRTLEGLDINAIWIVVNIEGDKIAKTYQRLVAVLVKRERESALAPQIQYVILYIFCVVHSLSLHVFT